MHLTLYIFLLLSLLPICRGIHTGRHTDTRGTIAYIISNIMSGKSLDLDFSWIFKARSLSFRFNFLLKGLYLDITCSFMDSMVSKPILNSLFIVSTTFHRQRIQNVYHKTVIWNFFIEGIFSLSSLQSIKLSDKCFRVFIDISHFQGHVFFM